MLRSNIISFSEPKSIVSEAYRALRTNIEFSLNKENQKVILVTSSHIGEGKSSVASNLATVFAMQNKKTILIDADMRRGVQHKNFGIPNVNGLSNCLANMQFNKQDFVKKTDIPDLFLINCGTVPPNPAELLSLIEMQNLIEQLKKIYDIIIVDGAPVLPVTDSVILSAIVDKVIIVASFGETHKEELKATKNILVNAGANICGVVLNKVEMHGTKYGRYNKYSKYGQKYYSYSSNDRASD